VVRRDLDALIVAEDSWGPRFLYVNEINGERAETGLDYLLDAMVTREVTSARQDSALGAGMTPRDRPIQQR